MQPFDSLDRLERLRILDPATALARSAVARLAQPQELRDVLHGTWLGHPLHPVLTDVPIGCWTSAALLDLVPGTGPAASALIATGAAAWFPTAAAGWVDWSKLHQPEQRAGLVHALANAAALVLHLGSLRARAHGRYAKGKALSTVGLGALVAGGVIGGHLSFRRATGANRTADVAEEAPRGWTEVCPVDELPDGEPVERDLAGVPVLLFRTGTTVAALHGRCTHLAAPLHEGRVRGRGAEACIVCPWHGSTFRLRDGAVVHGPATAPQPGFDTRVSAGRLELRLRA